MDQAFSEIVRLGGLQNEWDYMYYGAPLECRFVESKARAYINGSIDISQDEEEIGEALMEHGPLAVGLNAAWMQFYQSGVSHPVRKVLEMMVFFTRLVSVKKTSKDIYVTQKQSIMQCS